MSSARPLGHSTLLIRTLEDEKAKPSNRAHWRAAHRGGDTRLAGHPDCGLGRPSRGPPWKAPFPGLIKTVHEDALDHEAGTMTMTIGFGTCMTEKSYRSGKSIQFRRQCWRASLYWMPFSHLPNVFFQDGNWRWFKRHFYIYVNIFQMLFYGI